MSPTTPEPPVTPAEIKCLREHLGFTNDTLGRALTSESAGRTVRRWESGSSAIPDDVAAEVRALVAFTDSYVERLAATLRSQTTPTLTVYRDDPEYHHAHPDMTRWTAAWHRAVAVRAARQVEGEVRINFPE